MGRPYKCPYCSSSATVSKGVRKTKQLGDRRIRRCKACRRKFTPKNQQPAEPVQGSAIEPKHEPDAAETPAEIATPDSQP